MIREGEGYGEDDRTMESYEMKECEDVWKRNREQGQKRERERERVRRGAKLEKEWSSQGDKM